MKTNAWLAVATAFYLISLYLVQNNSDWSPALRVAVTLTPVFPGVFYLRSMLRSFAKLDEMQRRIRLEAWAFALTGTVVVSTILNVLNANGLGLTHYPYGLEIGGVFLTIFTLWCIGMAVSNLRYR